MRGDGTLVLKQEEIEDVAVGFYRDLFTTHDNLDPVVSLIMCQGRFQL
jgi:hypothetical protein